MDNTKRGVIVGYVGKVTIFMDEDEFNGSHELEILDAGGDGVFIRLPDNKDASIFININDWPLIRKTINAFMEGP